jgi:hypothetical protein
MPIPPRRPFQFSLLALMGLTAGAAVLMAGLLYVPKLLMAATFVVGAVFVPILAAIVMVGIGSPTGF